MDRRALFMEALRLRPGDAQVWCNLADTLDGPADTLVLYDGRTQRRYELQLEALRLQPDSKAFQNTARAGVPDSVSWHRNTHSAFAEKTNVLFATLLLGLQRLEEMKLLPLTHLSVLEDMLEGWTWGDI